MDYNRIMTRVQAIVKNPKATWPVIAGEQTTVRELYLGYILLLAAIQGAAITISPLPYGTNVHLAQNTTLAKVKAAGIAWIRRLVRLRF